MSLSRQEISHLITELQCLQGAQVVDCLQKGRRELFLVFKDAFGKILTLFLCFQEPFLRFHFTNQKYHGSSSELSRKLFFFLNESVVTKVEQPHADRILQLTFQKEKQGYRLLGEFFSKRPNLFLVDSENHILTSLNPVSSEVYTLPQRPIEPIVQNPSLFSSEEVERHYLDLEREALFQKGKRELCHELNNQIKKCEKWLQKQSQELHRLERWEQVQQEGELIQANLYRLQKGMVSLEVEDWFHPGQSRLLNFDPHQEPAARLSQLFRQAKKMRGGIERGQAQLAKTAASLEQWKKGLKLAKDALTESHLQVIREKWSLPVSQKSLKPNVSLPYLEYQSEAGLKMWVGKGAKQNESLTFSYAKGSDWWLHVRDFPGAHVVIRATKGQRPDAESLKDAFQLALAYSKAKNQGKADIILTQCKYVSRFGRKKRGQVHVSVHEIFIESFNNERFQKIKNRKIQLFCSN